MAQALKSNTPDLLYNGGGCSNPSNPPAGPNYFETQTVTNGVGVRHPPHFVHGRAVWLICVLWCYCS